MKSYLTLLFLLFSGRLLSQQNLCKALSAVNKTQEVNDTYITYLLKGDNYFIEYGNKNFKRIIPDTFNCSDLYEPGIPQLAWSNKNYIGLSISGGTYSFSTIVAPLNNKDSIKWIDGYLIDTTNTVFMTFERDDSLAVHLKINNINSKSHKDYLLNEYCCCAIIDECLDYSETHLLGYNYKKGTLIIYFRDYYKKGKTKQLTFQIN